MLFATPLITAYSYALTFVIGLCVGSFVNCMALRLIQEGATLTGRSHCPSCGHDLGLLDLIPVLSWLFLRGRCRYCGAHISVRYLLVELACAAGFCSILTVYDITLEAAQLMVLFAVLVCVTLTDIDAMVIPNGALLVAVLARAGYLVALVAMGPGGMVCANANVDPVGVVTNSLISAVAVGAAMLVIVLVMDRVLGRPSMGGGDLKLFAVAALYVGWQVSLFLIIVACLIGLVMGLIVTYGTGKDIDDEQFCPDRPAPADADAKSDDDDVPERSFSFGPAIAAATWIALLAGQPFLQFYLSLM